MIVYKKRQIKNDNKYVMAKLFVSVFFLLSALHINAQEFVQNNGTTSVNFKIKNFGSFVKGNFSDINISTNFDSNNLRNSFIEGTIKVNSIDTGNKKRDDHLITDDYFDALRFPEIKLASTKIEEETSGKFILTASLTIKQTTKKITLPITIEESNNTINLNAKFEVSRKDYEVGSKSWILSDTVYVEVMYSGKK